MEKNGFGPFFFWVGSTKDSSVFRGTPYRASYPADRRRKKRKKKARTTPQTVQIDMMTIVRAGTMSMIIAQSILGA